MANDAVNGVMEQVNDTLVETGSLRRSCHAGVNHVGTDIHYKRDKMEMESRPWLTFHHDMLEEANHLIERLVRM